MERLYFCALFNLGLFCSTDDFSRVLKNASNTKFKKILLSFLFTLKERFTASIYIKNHRISYVILNK